MNPMLMQLLQRMFSQQPGGGRAGQPQGGYGQNTYGQQPQQPTISGIPGQPGGNANAMQASQMPSPMTPGQQIQQRFGGNPMQQWGSQWGSGWGQQPQWGGYPRPQAAPPAPQPPAQAPVDQTNYAQDTSGVTPRPMSSRGRMMRAMQ